MILRSRSRQPAAPRRHNLFLPALQAVYLVAGGSRCS